MKKVVIVVEGGCVTSVFASEPDTKIVIVDYDNHTENREFSAEESDAYPIDSLDSKFRQQIGV